MSRIFGISGVCNLLGAIKTAKYFNLGPDDVDSPSAPDAIDRYYSVMSWLEQTEGRWMRLWPSARRNTFRGQKTDYVQEGDQLARERWHNLKYYTWVEQQGQDGRRAGCQRDPGWWRQHQEL